MPTSMPTRKHHWLRWVLVVLAAVVALVVGGTILFVDALAGPALAPLALPSLSTAAAGGSQSTIDGTWTAGQGSAAGYRVRISILGQGGDLVGRTSAVTGTVVIAGTQASSASFSVDLTTLESGGKPQPQLAQILGTAAYPNATFTLTTPIALGSTPAVGGIFTVSATGMLAMDGTSRSVTVPITARWDGSALYALGSIPISFSDWNIKTPFGLEDHGSVEFLLVLNRQP